MRGKAHTGSVGVDKIGDDRRYRPQREPVRARVLLDQSREAKGCRNVEEVERLPASSPRLCQWGRQKSVVGNTPVADQVGQSIAVEVDELDLSRGGAAAKIDVEQSIDANVFVVAHTAAEYARAKGQWRFTSGAVDGRS